MSCLALTGNAAIIGTNSSAQPLTAERLASLPVSQESAWKQYLERSTRQLQADQAVLRDEIKVHGKLLAPPQGSGTRGLSLERPASWYGQSEGRRIADILLSYQTPAGGWSKNINLTLHQREPGEHFAIGNISAARTKGETLPFKSWNFVGTFDNGATTSQLRFLAKVIAATEAAQAAPYVAACLRGLEYIFSAQYPNGGWPQVWPLAGGYHDAITYNDGAMVKVLALLNDIGQGKPEFGFVPRPTRERAAASVKRGIECILATQIIVGNRRTVWCQQHDVLSLKATPARAYEMAAQTSGESADIMIFLMEQPDPTPEIIRAVHAAAAWLEKTKLRDVEFKGNRAEGRRLVSAPGSDPLWARFYEIGTDRPVFGDRDKTIHDDVNEISSERTSGYAWFTDSPDSALKRYAAWCKTHPLTKD